MMIAIHLSNGTWIRVGENTPSGKIETLGVYDGEWHEARDKDGNLLVLYNNFHIVSIVFGK